MSKARVDAYSNRKADEWYLATPIAQVIKNPLELALARNPDAKNLGEWIRVAESDTNREPPRLLIWTIDCPLKLHIAGAAPHLQAGFGVKLQNIQQLEQSAGLLNDKVLPVFAEQGMSMIRILTDRGTDYYGKLESHAYFLYLALNDIEHTKTKAFHPQTNGICEMFHETILDEFYRVTFRRKLYTTLDELQADLDDRIRYYN